MVITLIIAFLVSIGLSLFLTPWVMRLATIIGAIDRPGERRIHKGTIPRLGGLSLYLSFFVALLFFLRLDSGIPHSSWIFERQGIVSLFLLLVVMCLGIWDDVHHLKASYKFVVQFIVANVAYFSGFNITSITHPFGSELLQLGMFDYPVTVLWIVGITNAFNLIDGLDGLASGVATIAFITIFPIAILGRDMASAVISLLLVGSLLGFLRYNFNPAKIFLGDSGSLFLGFALAIVSIKSSAKGTAAFSMLVPVLALGLPIMETILSMIRRFLGSFVPEENIRRSFTSKVKSMFVADKGHIHHRLIQKGFSQRKAVLVLYVVSSVFGMGAFSVTMSNNLVASLILLIAGAAIFVGVHSLRYKEMAILRNGILLPLYDRPILNRDSMKVFFDLAFMGGAYGMAQLLSGGFNHESPLGDKWLGISSVTIAIQFAVFLLSGVYKRTFRLIGIDDVLSMLKTVGVAVIASCFIHALIIPMSQTTIVMALLDFFFLLSLALGFRGSFLALQHLHRDKNKGGRKLLIYGADINGKWVLEKILQLNYSSLVPVGFLDEDPNMEGKTLSGYPVFGGHGKVEHLADLMNIDEIVVCDESMKPEVVRELKTIADRHKIKLTRTRFIFEDIETQEKPTNILPVFELTSPYKPVELVEETVEYQPRKTGVPFLEIGWSSAVLLTLRSLVDRIRLDI
jgi:UDP-GlcNAc:undecaprenyl-phosphate GlcNAc-1-phosphate transferase